ncbi:hypothetical protein BD414DRAFT_4122 [Trametes punicea]|nr:hypothetical protein BD414DRAFT_4122 [Trametes punicea]
MFQESVTDRSVHHDRSVSPIEGRRRVRSASRSESYAWAPTSSGASPLPVKRVRTESQGPRDDAVTYASTPPRSPSAPPSVYRQPLSMLGKIQEVDERGGWEIVRPGYPVSEIEALFERVKLKHLQSECAGDPLCATHRKRPVRSSRRMDRPEYLASPHKRGPHTLWERRPTSTIEMCDELDCVRRNCADCVYLRSRGGLLHTKIARRNIEDRLDTIHVTSRYADDIIALLYFRSMHEVPYVTV